MPSFSVSILHIIFYKIPINLSRDTIITRILEKTEYQRPLCSPKAISYAHLNCIFVISNNTHLVCKFLCDFIQHKPKSALSQKFWKSGDYSTQQDMPAKFVSVSSFKVSILHGKFSTISCSRIRGRTATKICGKTE